MSAPETLTFGQAYTALHGLLGAMRERVSPDGEMGTLLHAAELLHLQESRAYEKEIRPERDLPGEAAG